MKFCRFISSDPAGDSAFPRYAILDGENVQEISAAPWTEWSTVAKPRPLPSVRLLAPVEPRKIVCVGRNYAAHAAELGNEVPQEPLIFLKPPSSFIGPGEPIVLPKCSSKVEHEGELGLVVVRRAAHLSYGHDALPYAVAYKSRN